MSHRFDATLKNIVVDHPSEFAPVFNFPRTEPATPLNVDLSTVTAATDVAFGLGVPIHEIVDLNFQSGPDPDLPSRLLVYNALLHARHLVPVRSIAVLLRPKADGELLTGNLTYGGSGHRVEFEYGVVRMWQQSVESFLQGGVALLPLATLCRMPADRPLTDALRDVVREIDRRLSQETSHAEAVRLMTAAFILTGLRVQKSDLTAIYQGVRIMQESTAYDAIFEEGELRGELRGQLNRSHSVLLLLGRKKLGATTPQIEAALTAIQDLGRLDRMTAAVLTAKSWDELLATA